MPLPTTCTLEYHVTPTNVSAARMQTAMGAVVLYSSALTDPVINGLLGCTIMSDATTTVAGVVKRVIVIALGPGFFVLFPNPTAWANVFSGFYKYTLALALSSVVAELTPVFA
jgi:hypothetical protein